MDIKTLEQKMVECGLVIRAIPNTIQSILEVRHEDEYSVGVNGVISKEIVYLKEYKREMLRIVRIPNNAGMFIITNARHTSRSVDFGKPKKYYNSIKDVIEDLERSL